jgi:hypothetical protein
MFNFTTVETQESKIAMRELDHRAGDGIEVTLLWNTETNGVSVLVGEQEGNSFQFEVPPADALEAFHHPFAYAADGELQEALAAPNAAGARGKRG